ncbi:MAG TPA: hypothetical protein VGV61_15060 [Thermoanaerobaculia bacterium]|nr:hypothetical protein [Thermoanaerobaculia bacterium]
MSVLPAEPEEVAQGRAERLRALDVPAAVLPELLAYTAHPYGAPPAVPLPLPDEPHLAAWREYAAEAGVGKAEAERGAAAALRRRLVQLQFPIAAGMATAPSYRAATLRGVPPPPSEGVELVDPAGITLAIHATPAGAVPVVVARHRADFETLVRALASRNEPVPVPASMGACLVQGLVNQDRVARYRARWAAQAAEASEAAWQQEMGRLAADKPSYQDRLVLLSSGAYAGVPASEVGRDEGRWLADSLRIRGEHECFHYLTVRLFGRMRSNALDEVVADLAGLAASDGAYSPPLARRVLGLEGDLLHPRPDARLLLYCAELSSPAQAALAALVGTAIDGLARLCDEVGLAANSASRGPLLLAAAARGLDGLGLAGRH